MTNEFDIDEFEWNASGIPAGNCRSRPERTPILRRIRRIMPDGEMQTYALLADDWLCAEVVDSSGGRHWEPKRRFPSRGRQSIETS
jgi:hypothetical protein